MSRKNCEINWPHGTKSELSCYNISISKSAFSISYFSYSLFSTTYMLLKASSISNPCLMLKRSHCFLTYFCCTFFVPCGQFISHFFLDICSMWPEIATFTNFKIKETPSIAPYFQYCMYMSRPGDYQRKQKLLKDNQDFHFDQESPSLPLTNKRTGNFVNYKVKTLFFGQF